jgi:hypothetical protein
MACCCGANDSCCQGQYTQVAFTISGLEEASPNFFPQFPNCSGANGTYICDYGVLCTSFLQVADVSYNACAGMGSVSADLRWNWGGSGGLTFGYRSGSGFAFCDASKTLTKSGGCFAWCNCDNATATAVLS